MMILADRAATRNLDSFTDNAKPFLSDAPPDAAVPEPIPPSVADVLDHDEPPVPFAGWSCPPPAPAVADAPFPPRVLDYSWQEPLARQVAAWLRLFIGADQVVELRALNVPLPNGGKVTVSGFYNRDGLGRMANDALELTADAEGVYFTLNPLDPSLLARRYNKAAQARDTASDADVLKRRWLLVDADPVRKSGISATAEEKRRAWEIMRAVHGWLQGKGWPEPVLADSGNGYHLLYRIDLPGDDGGLVKNVLEALAARFDGDAVKIDTKVFNPSRIVKLYGTVARKGSSLRGRPHRRTGVLAAPAEVGVVSREQLEAVAGERVRPAAPPEAPRATSSLAAGVRSDLVRRARNYLMKVPPAVSGEGGHNQTFKAACILMRFGLTKEEALEVLREWNETCQPPWPEKDLLHKLNDAAERVGPQANPLLPASNSQVGAGGGESQPELPVLPAREAADDPHRLAQLFLDQSRAADGAVTLRHWNGDWYRWDGAAYRQLAEAEVRAGLTRAIKAEFDRLNLLERITQLVTKEPHPDQPAAPAREPNARKVTTTVVGNALQALRSVALIPSVVAPPAWLHGEGPFAAGEVLAAKNGLVHLPSLLEGRDCLRPLTPDLFTTVALDYEIDAQAGQPTAWLDFLGALWPHDGEAVGLLQEWFGYCLTADTSQQKMLFVVGPKRAGKGTLARVLAALVGPANVAGPTLGSLASNFGLAPLLNKPVAVISDARFSGRSGDQAVVVERLLSISGEDLLTIDRKNREHLTAKLPTRFTILTNELPRLTDASAALPSRLLILQLTRSWYGQEDTELTAKLLRERAGIFLWAVEGLKRLRQRGHFVQPESGVETSRRLVELSSPVTAFVQDRCELGADKRVGKALLFGAWRSWCEECGHEPGSLATFGRNLAAAFPAVQSSRPREADTRVTIYAGIGLRRL
jgi:putative DNA primase/helicase